MIRLMEVLLHGGTVVSAWSARQIHQAILTSFRIAATAMASVNSATICAN
jgi:hypothetical protein